MAGYQPMDGEVLVSGNVIAKNGRANVRNDVVCITRRRVPLIIFQYMELNKDFGGLLFECAAL